MNKTELVHAFAEVQGTTQVDANASLTALMTLIRQTLLQGEEVTLPGIGKLKVAVRAGRNGRNPSTGAAIIIPEKKVVKFSPSSDFKESIQ